MCHPDCPSGLKLFSSDCEMSPLSPPPGISLSREELLLLRLRTSQGAVVLIQYVVNTVIYKSDSSCSTLGHLRRAIPGPEFLYDLLGPLLEPNCSSTSCSVQSCFPPPLQLRSLQLYPVNHPDKNLCLRICFLKSPSSDTLPIFGIMN